MSIINSFNTCIDNAVDALAARESNPRSWEYLGTVEAAIYDALQLIARMNDRDSQDSIINMLVIPELFLSVYPRETDYKNSILREINKIKGLTV